MRSTRLRPTHQLTNDAEPENYPSWSPDGSALVFCSARGAGAGLADLGYRPDEKICVVTGGGSGVGLTLARQIARAHDGRLEYLPRAPTGAVFRLFLPRASSSLTASTYAAGEQWKAALNLRLNWR